MSKSTTYLGDGVYLTFDGYQLWLAVNDRQHKVVALDRDVFTNLCTEGTKIFQMVALTSGADFKAEVVGLINATVPDV